MVGYCDVGHISYPRNPGSQIGFVFLNGGTTFTWKSRRQTLVAASTSHSEIIDLYEASNRCMWLLKMMNFVESSSGIGW